MTERTVGILQPGYLPWLGFFEQVYRSDIFVFYDDVQYDKEGWRNRNRIKTAQGIHWLSVPVQTKGRELQTVRDAEIDNRTDWRSKHLISLQQNYAKAPFYAQYADFLNSVYTREWRWLIDLDMELIHGITKFLGMERDFRFSSDLGIKGERVERLVAICQHLGATCFYEGAAGRNYMDESQFVPHNIRLEFQQYPHPVYHQQHKKAGFLPYLSVIDLLLNHGADSLAVLTHQIEIDPAGRA